MAKKTKSGGNPNIVKLWPTTMLAKRFAELGVLPDPASIVAEDRFISPGDARYDYTEFTFENGLRHSHIQRAVGQPVLVPVREGHGSG